MSPFETGLIAGVLVSAICFVLFGARNSAAGLKLSARLLDRHQSAGPGRTSKMVPAGFGLFAVALLVVWSGTGAAPAGSTRAPDGGAFERGGIAGMDAEISRIENYLASVGRAPSGNEAPAPQSRQGGLPDVETMIGGLKKRLEAEPGDVEGWRTLGWSYLNTGRPAEALKAYEKALAIAPDREDLKEGVRSARAAAGGEAETASDAAVAPAATKNGSE